MANANRLVGSKIFLLATALWLTSLNGCTSMVSENAHAPTQASGPGYQSATKRAVLSTDTVAVDAIDEVLKLIEHRALLPKPLITAHQSTYDNIWERIRAKRGMPDLDNKLVSHYEKFYAKASGFFNYLGPRAHRYLFHVVEEVEARNMPLELALLPVVESAFNPKATSSAQAVGLWQFISSTGKVFGLEQNVFFDERRDVLESTRAALDYLQYLHKRFGDWRLALTAYNWGEGSVSQAMRKASASGKEPTFSNLRLPRETQHYIPKLQALENIITDPDKFEVVLPDIPDHPFFRTVKINADMDIDLIAQLAEISVDDFLLLNPKHKREIVVVATDPEILLPFDESFIFEENLQNYDGVMSNWKVVKLKKNTSPTALAKNWDIEESELRRVNGGIPSGKLIQAGSTVLVPRLPGDQSLVSDAIMENPQLVLLPVYRDIRYVVKSGDTLSQIAVNFGVSVRDIKQWNKLKSSLIRLGQKLIIRLERKPGSEVEVKVSQR